MRDTTLVPPVQWMAGCASVLKKLTLRQVIFEHEVIELTRLPRREAMLLFKLIRCKVLKTLMNSL